MIRIDFDELVAEEPSTVYGYFRTPQDWTRLYGAFGEPIDRGEGWIAVPLRRLPFPLVARITAAEEPHRVAWEFGGFFTGTGEIRLRPSGTGTAIGGYEAIAIPSLLGLGRIVENRYIDRRFRALWSSGWQRLGAERRGSPGAAQPTG